MREKDQAKRETKQGKRPKFNIIKDARSLRSFVLINLIWFFLPSAQSVHLTFHLLHLPFHCVLPLGLGSEGNEERRMRDERTERCLLSVFVSRFPFPSFLFHLWSV